MANRTKALKSVHLAGAVMALATTLRAQSQVEGAPCVLGPQATATANPPTGFMTGNILSPFECEKACGNFMVANPQYCSLQPPPVCTFNSKIIPYTNPCGVTVTQPCTMGLPPAGSGQFQGSAGTQSQCSQLCSTYLQQDPDVCSISTPLVCKFGGQTITYTDICKSWGTAQSGTCVLSSTQPPAKVMSSPAGDASACGQLCTTYMQNNPQACALGTLVCAFQGVIGGPINAGASFKNPCPPPAPKAPPKGAAEAVPPPAERDPAMAPATLALAGAVTGVRAKVLDKEADDKTQGLARVRFFDGGVEISQYAKWTVWKPGFDPKEQQSEGVYAVGDQEMPVPPGTWDLQIEYDEGGLAQAQGWVRGVKFAAGKLWKAEVTLAAPMEYVLINATVDGRDVGDDAIIQVFKAGADQQEVQALVTFAATRKTPIAAGSYDLRITYEKDGVNAKADVKDFAVGGDHGVLKQTLALTKY